MSHTVYYIRDDSRWESLHMARVASSSVTPLYTCSCQELNRLSVEATHAHESYVRELTATSDTRRAWKCQTSD